MALVLGLLMSAGLYFAYLWPSVAPDDDDEDGDEVAAAEKPADKVADKPADTTDDKPAEPA